jgi:hypothetical protein
LNMPAASSGVIFITISSMVDPLFSMASLETQSNEWQIKS